MTPEQLKEYLDKRQETGVLASEVTYGDLRLRLDADAYVAVAERCKSDDRLSFDFFDCLFGIDRRDEGFEVVTILYSIEHRHRVILSHPCTGGRETPVAPTLTHLWRGADWHEREAWDMFGIEFDGHPGLAPRILCTENFEGWPLRKDFFLGSRAAKPWPGVKEPAETDEDGNVIEKVQLIGDAPGPTVLDELMAEQAKKVNPRQPELSEAEARAHEEEGAPPTSTARAKDEMENARSASAEKAERARQKAAEARARKAAERAAAGDAEAGEGVSTPPDQTADAPQDAARAPEGERGGPPAAPTEDTLAAGESSPEPKEGASRPEPPVEGGIHEKIDEQRADGTLPPDPRPSPEGSAPEQPGEDPDVTPSGQRGDADDAAAGYARVDEPREVEDARESADDVRRDEGVGDAERSEHARRDEEDGQ